ncbi:MAG: hypothetical protein ACTMHL_03695 [Janibacter sp.]
MSSPSTEVGPGFLAFVAFFILAVALWLLMRNMFTRMRRMNLARRAEEQREEQAQPPEEDDPAPGDPAAGGGSGVGDGPEEGQRRGDEV